MPVDAHVRHDPGQPCSEGAAWLVCARLRTERDGYVNTGSNSRSRPIRFSYRTTPNATEGVQFGHSPNVPRSRPGTEPRLIAHALWCVPPDPHESDESSAHHVASRPHAMCAVALRMSRCSLNGPTRSQRAIPLR